MNRIKELRAKLGMSQAALASELRFHQNTISQWEIGTNNIDSEKLHLLADYFKVTVDYLLGRTDNPNPADAKSPIYDDEVLEMMEAIHKRPELKILFHTTKKVRKEDILFIDQMASKLSEGYRD